MRAPIAPLSDSVLVASGVFMSTLLAVGLSSEGWAAVSFIGAACVTGPCVAWIQTRRVARTAETVASSVGEKNGHGTVQDATAEILRRIDGLQTSVDAVVDSGQNVTARLKAHDLEFAARRRAHDLDVEAIRAEIREARDVEIEALRNEIRTCMGGKEGGS